MKKVVYLALAFVLAACGGKQNDNRNVVRPAFSGDSAYAFVQRQMNMGARVPDSRAHTECVFYLMQQMEQYGNAMELQLGKKTNYAGQEQQIYNIIGRFGPLDKSDRILLCAHYDCRPWSDEEDLYEQRILPVPGANDGASGVGVLLEIARQLSLMQADSAAVVPPVDIVFFDCEDMGTPSFYTGVQRENTWCLGSQLWAERAAENGTNTKYRFGILLDMVGDPEAVFPMEYYSQQYAGNYLEKIWRAASALGYDRYFIRQSSYPVIDDHVSVNTLAGIPCVDIVHYDPRGNAGFPVWWHTQQDDMHHVSATTLQAVGEVVMACLD